MPTAHSSMCSGRVDLRTVLQPDHDGLNDERVGALITPSRGKIGRVTSGLRESDHIIERSADLAWVWRNCIHATGSL